jgi:hypothetical protein
MTVEPGLDRHDWESRLASIEDDLRDDPGSALPILADIVEEMVSAVGYDLDDPAVREGEEREVVAEFTAARETADRVERAEEVDPGDVGDSVGNLLELYRYLIERTPR